MTEGCGIACFLLAVTSTANTNDDPIDSSSPTRGGGAVEIGILMALGADASDVVRMVLGRVAVLVGFGVAVGTGASVWGSRFVASFVYGFEATEPPTFVAAACILSVVAAVAGWLPARRASRIDPASELRLNH